MKSLLMLCVCLQTFLFSQTANISYMEYFVDSDPGRGNGTQVDFTADSIIDVNFTVDLSAVSDGLHTLYVRLRTDTVWNIALTQSFIKSPSNAGATIVYGEYFIDSDPGRGSGTQFDLSAGALIDEAVTVNLDSTSVGLHTLYVRVRDSNNQWSISQTRSFIRLPSVAGNAVAQMEYFFNTDPGLGNATQIPISTNPMVDVSHTISMSGLDQGLHTLYVRSRDTSGNWSITFTRLVLKSDVSSASNIIEMEYFFNSDPGFGLGSQLTFSPDSIVDVSAVLDISALDDGMHTLYVRAISADGRGTIRMTRPFIKNSNIGETRTITALEYVLEKDSVFSDTTTISSFESADSVSVDFTIQMADIDLDQYNLHVAAIDNKGNRSVDYVRSVEKIRSDTPTVVMPLEDIVLDEDFGTYDFSLADVFDDDINTSETLSYSVSGANLVTLAFEGSSVRLSSILDVFGMDTLYFSATDSDGSSAVDTVLLTINDVNDPPASPSNFVADAGDDIVTLSWTANNEADLLRYRVYRATSNSLPNAPLDSVSAAATSYADQTVTNGTTYYYWLVALDSAGLASAATAAAEATPLLESLNTELAVFQNPVLGSELLLTLTADNPLTAMPSISVTQNGNFQNLSVLQIGSSMENFRAKHSLAQTGSFSVTSMAQSENNTSDNVTRNFTASFVTPEAASTIVVAKNRASIFIPKRSFAKGQNVLAEFYERDNILRIQPELNAENAVRIELAYGEADFAKEDKLFLYQKVDDEWEQLGETQIFAGQNLAVAYTNTLSEFKIAYDQTASGTNIVPAQFALKQNFPNPFNPVTKIRYDLAMDGHVSVIVYNTLGQKVRTLLRGFQRAKGGYTLSWDGTNDGGRHVASGMYYYRLVTPRFTQTKKMILIK